MSFLKDLPCQDPASFSCMQQRKIPDRTPVAHDVPLNSDEKTILPDRTPYFLRMLQSQAAKKVAENGPDKSKKGKRRHDKEEEEGNSSIPSPRGRKASRAE